MEQIIIDGVNLTDLKVKYDALAKEQAEMRQSIRQGSSKFLADKSNEVDALILQLKDVETEEEGVEVANKIIPLLKTISFVSDVSGVSYEIPYYSRQGEYCPNGDPITRIIEDGDNEVLSDSDHEVFTELYRIAESMESDVNEWNSSYC